MLQEIRNSLAQCISTAISREVGEVLLLLEKPKNPQFGEAAFPCFLLAKSWGENPQKCAAKLATALTLPPSIKSALAVGPFVNFHFKREQVAKTVLENIQTTGLALQSQAHKNETIIVEYSSPNIAKPFHVGHLRATLIGNAIDRVYRALGYNAISINHLGDWGTQFGYVWAGCALWGKPEKPSVSLLVELYRKATALKAEQEKDPEKVTTDSPNVSEIAKQYFLDLELGKPEAVEFWKWCKDISLLYFQESYKRLNVNFDHYTGESFYSDKMARVQSELESAGLLKESQGALGVDLEEPLGFARTYTPDGRSLYLTRDIATVFYRKETYNFSKAVYIVGAPQTLHFQQLKGIIKALKHSYAEDIIHVPFGHVLGMKTRGHGDFIELNDLLDEAFERAKTSYQNQVSRRPEGLDENAIAEAVALSALVFSTLSKTRMKDVQFHWDHALAFQGDTGPYLLYAYARINSIREKAEKAGISLNANSVAQNIDFSVLDDEHSAAILLTLAEYPHVLEKTLSEHEPAVLAGYALDVAKAFSRGYNELQVIGAEPQTAKARLALFEATRQVLGNTIELLGMRLIERM